MGNTSSDDGAVQTGAQDWLAFKTFSEYFILVFSDIDVLNNMVGAYNLKVDYAIAVEAGGGSGR